MFLSFWVMRFSIVIYFLLSSCIFLNSKHVTVINLVPNSYAHKKKMNFSPIRAIFFSFLIKTVEPGQNNATIIHKRYHSDIWTDCIFMIFQEVLTIRTLHFFLIKGFTIQRPEEDFIWWDKRLLIIKFTAIQQNSEHQIWQHKLPFLSTFFEVFHNSFGIFAY